jgi:hypothetical protein
METKEKGTTLGPGKATNVPSEMGQVGMYTHRGPWKTLNTRQREKAKKREGMNS